MSVSSERFYYLHNFQQVLDWVATRYDDLLDDAERAFLRQFPQLPQASRALLVRMVMRKGEVFRAGRLRYDEIGCSVQAAEPLIAQGWLTADPLLDIDELFSLLRKNELLAAFRVSDNTTSKTALHAELCEVFTEPRTLAGWQVETDEVVYRVAVGPLCERLRLMFFGNLSQDWSEFVLSDLGIYRYETVACSHDSRAFRARQDIDDYLHLHDCRQRIAEEDDPQTVLQEIPAIPFENDWLEMRRNRLLFLIGRQHERRMQWELAHEAYANCAYPGARLRRLRVLERAGQCQQALPLAEAAFAQPESEAERQALLRLLPRLRRRCGQTVARQRRLLPERIDLVLPCTAQPIAVECRVRDHFSTDGGTVWYVENTLINSLFGLLCWPAVFAPVPGAFFHPFHHGPADLHSPDFHRRRTALFDACLAQLDDGSYRQAILATYDSKFGIQSPFVFWNSLDAALLETALACVPPAHLKVLFVRLLADIQANRFGFPDLIQFWPQQARYRMLEVKGPGDRLQDNQLRWMEYCMAHGIPVAVCHVQWQEAA
ncbi:Fanconi-associated nuclease [Oxalicibacterium flavum]|uniref:phosphodiesterase I n=1 Tax=Oxalicibacterium flavum TaxID=179467 RepID=A0A8J2XXI5_9BURK|nr:VRR-NUC domain-containing protein [Oxalicibacterium flavum]GGC01841.1 Fanconi-associated nuclease [Oxalicibacterium flavum]